MTKIILEILYILCGLVSIACGLYAFFDKQNTRRLGTACFWILFGLIFIIGPYIPSEVNGGFLVIMAGISATKHVVLGSLSNSTEEYRIQKAKKLGNKLFFPALSIGVIAFAIAQFTKLGGLIGLGIGSFIALVFALCVTQEKGKYIAYDSARLLQQMGAAVILPQFLAALGALFAKAGVGAVIAGIMSGIIPHGSQFWGVVGYCLSMAVFTIIMGNAFAAFAVITAGVGIPFVIQLGANPAIVGALGLTAGYCGTLLTPMAANFNIIPATLLEMKNTNGVILQQIPFAIILLCIHIVLMYMWAF